MGAAGGAPTPGTRLMITKMVLENFKSYAGSQEIGPFHKCFSSVVGPNGSGKSNVIDALLFVFGKRAKQLRLNKVSELIHKSSAFPNLEACSVEVHFQLIVDNDDHPDDFEVVPGSEFVVTRTAFSNNQSKYTVGSKTSTYSEVGLLLRSHGIDLDNNRFLILQGEVEQIAMMKPKAAAPGEEGLLEYLEDIIGSNRFVEKIEEVSWGRAFRQSAPSPSLFWQRLKANSHTLASPPSPSSRPSQHTHTHTHTHTRRWARFSTASTSCAPRR